jgi:uracil-DNA glycosylase
VDPRALAQHLRFYQELGVTGISRDAEWRRRSGSSAGDFRLKASLDDARDAPEPVEGAEATPGESEIQNESEMERESAWLPASAGSEPEPVADSASPLPLIRSPEALAAIRNELGDCTRCKLHGLGRRQIVFGVGNPAADVMFIGEAPGADEDVQGIPFVGRAGQLLTKMIEAMGLRRDEVYIANVLKCRPPGNRDPQPDEVESCEPFLFKQIASVQPQVIIALGAFAARTLLKTLDPISRMRGRVYDYRGAKLIPTFHPSFLLRSPGYKREAWEDLKKALGVLGREPPSAQAAASSPD